MRLKAASALAASTIALGSCYDFDAPIDPTPKYALDPALLGTWRCLNADAKPDATPVNFVVTRARERVYSIRFEEKDAKNPELYEAHASEVKGHMLLNVRAVDPRFPTKPWTFARYSFLLPDVLRVQLVNDETLKGVEQAPASLRTALERLDGNAELYVDLCICVRTVAEPKGSAQ
jgi:hypothetical protein